MPSRSIESCAGVRLTLPILVCGQTNRPRSMRFENRQRPCPSYQSSLTRSPRFPRNANSAPECGDCASTCWTSTARPSNPFLISVAPHASQIVVAPIPPSAGCGIAVIGRQPTAPLPVLRHQHPYRRSTGCPTGARSRSCRLAPAALVRATVAPSARSPSPSPARILAPVIWLNPRAFPTSPAAAMCKAGRSQLRAARPYRAPNRSAQRHRAVSPASDRPSSAAALTPAPRPRSVHSYDRSYDHSHHQQPHPTPRYPSTKGPSIADVTSKTRRPAGHAYAICGGPSGDQVDPVTSVVARHRRIHSQDEAIGLGLLNPLREDAKLRGLMHFITDLPGCRA